MTECLDYLAPLGIAAAKFAGVHLLPHVIPALKKVPALNSLAGSGVSNAGGGSASGLGVRFAIGFGSAYYFNNEQFHHGINICLGAIKDSIL